MHLIILIFSLLYQQESLACSPSGMYLNSTYPTDGSVDVALDSNIYIEFKGSVEGSSCCQVDVFVNDEPLAGTYDTICNDTIGWNLRCHTIFTPERTLT